MLGTVSTYQADFLILKIHFQPKSEIFYPILPEGKSGCASGQTKL